jgi:hypothetical protein
MTAGFVSGFTGFVSGLAGFVTGFSRFMAGGFLAGFSGCRS